MSEDELRKIMMKSHKKNSAPMPALGGTQRGRKGSVFGGIMNKIGGTSRGAAAMEAAMGVSYEEEEEVTRDFGQLF